VRAQLIAGGTPDTGLEFARLIEAENAYRANAAVLRRANSLSYSLLSLKAGRITKRFLDGSKVGMIQKCAEQYLASSIALAADLAKKAGKEPGSVKVAMAFENDPFSLDVRAGVMDDIKKHGLKVVIDDKLPRDLSDMSATLTKVKALNPDLLVVSGHSKGAATAARQIKEMKIATPMVAMTHCEAAKITDKFGDAVNDFLCPTQWAETLTYSDKYFGTAAEYDKLFKATFEGYDASVPYQAAQASAAVLVWKDAFERAQSFDTDKVRDAIAATDMATFYGNIKFSSAGNNIAKPMVLRQIQNGKYNVVAPQKWASHKVNHPRMAK